MNRIIDFIFYAASSIFSFPITLLLTPIFATYLTEKDFSQMNYFSQYSIILGPIFSLSFYQYFMYIYYKKTEAERNIILVSIFSFLLIFGLILIPFLFFLIKYYLIWTKSNLLSIHIILIILLNSILSVGYGLWSINLKYERKSIKYFFLSIFRILSVGLLSYLLVRNLALGAIGRFIAFFIADFVIFISYYFLYIKKISIKSLIIKDALLFSTPIILSTVLIFQVQNSDYFQLEHIHNIKEFANYTMANMIAGFFVVVYSSILSVIEPDIFQLIQQRNKQKLIRIAFIFLIIILLSDTIGFVLSNFLINYFSNGRYNSAIIYFKPLLFVRSIEIYIYFLGTFITALGLTKAHFLAILLIFIFSFLIYSSFISKFNYIGAVYAKLFLMSLWLTFILIIIRYRIFFNRIKITNFFSRWN